MKRFFVTQALGKDFVLSGPEHNHLANVLRTRAGEHVTVCNGDDNDYEYKAVEITRSATQMRFVKSTPNRANPDLNYNLTVYMPVIKFDNLTLVVQKLNELGVAELQLYAARNCNLSLDTVNAEKLKLVAQQSCKQCGRSTPIHIYKTLFGIEKIAESMQTQYDTAIFLDEKEQGKRLGMITIPPEHPKSLGAALILGPEGGFTDTERTVLRDMPNVQPVSMGRRILRAETAAIAASAIILGKMGEM